MKVRRYVLLGAVSSLAAVSALLASCVGDAPSGLDSGADTGVPGDGGGNPDTGTPPDGGGDTGVTDSGNPCVLPDAGVPGTKDNSFQFNNNAPPTAANFSPNAVTVHPTTGDIYVTGPLANSNGCMNANGSFDLGLYAFTPTGLPNTLINPAMAPVCLNFDTVDSGYSVAVDAKSRVIVGGLSFSNGNGLHAIVARYTVGAGASLDTSFNTTGKLDLKAGVPGMGNVYGIATDVNNRIYLAGSTGGQGDPLTKGFLVRLGENGAIDMNFTVQDTTVQGFFGVDVDANGVTVSGAGRPNGRFVIKRYTLAGQPDGTFADAGVATSGAATDFNRGLLRMSNGGFATIGARSPSGASGSIGVAVVGPTGAPDAIFNNGQATLAALKFDLFWNTQGLGTLCNGSLLVAGRYDYIDAGQDIAVVRFKPDGTQDTTFGGTGVFLSGHAGNDITVGATQDPLSKKILVMGRDSQGRLQMYRIHP
jgi:uncharacterized delta-60 repeat protein